jgi:hypothetical protein
MQTILIDILNAKAIRLLRDLELLQLIKMRTKKTPLNASGVHGIQKYKGTMGKQPISDIEKQLNELRNEWD